MTKRNPSSPPGTPPAPLSFRRMLRKLEVVTTYLRSLSINLAFLLAFLAVVPLVAIEMMRDRVTIEPIGVPESIAATGLTSDVAANRLWDALQQVGIAANTDKERLVLLPASRRVEFAFPDAGFSFESLIYHVRRFLGLYETRIAGEFVCTTDPCTKPGLQLRLRLVRDRLDVIELPPMGSGDERQYFMTGAAELLRYLDPFVAAAYLLNTDPEHAMAGLRKIVNTKHKDAKWANNLIGQALETQGHMDKAEASFRAALALDPRHLPSMIDLARLQAETGRAAAAITTIDRALAIDPKSAHAWSVRGMAHEKANDRTAALADYTKAAAMAPESSWPYWRLGYFLYNQGDNAGAKVHYDTALENDPDFVEARYGLAAVALVTNDRKEVLRQYREVLRTKPGDATATAAVAGAYAINRQFPEAIEHYRQALAKQPQNADWLTKLGNLQRSTGDLNGALEALARATQIDPSLANAFFELGLTYRGLKRAAESQAAFQTFLAKAPTSELAVLAKYYVGGREAVVRSP